MKKILISTIILGLFSWGGIAASQNDLKVEIPVRVYQNNIMVQNLTNENFSVQINKTAHPIIDFQLIQKNILKTTKPRNLILKFTATYIGDDNKKVLDFIIGKFLTAKDRLFIWTPLNRVLEVKLKKDPLQTSGEIFGLLKKDTVAYLSNRKMDQKQIENHLSARGGSVDDSLRVVNNCTREWQMFKQKHLLPDLNKYIHLSNILNSTDSVNVIIDFHQKNIASIISRILALASSIKKNFSGSSEPGVGSVLSGVRVLEKSLMIGREYPSNHITNALFKGNLGYHVVFYTNTREGVSAGAQIPDLQDILTTICKTTGGLAVDSNNFEDALKQVLEHSDYSYQLSVNLNRAIEDKVVEIKGNGIKGDFLFPKLILKSEIGQMISQSKMPQVEIKDFKCTGHVMSFSIVNFAIAPDQQIGMVDVKIVITDNSGQVVFNTGKVLKTKNPSITIKGIGLPKQLKGKLDFKMTVLDMVSKKQGMIQTKINL